MCMARTGRGREGGIAHHIEKKKEEVEMACARTVLFFYIVHKTILQPIKLYHFLTLPHLRHIMSFVVHLIPLPTITFAIHTKPTE